MTCPHFKRENSFFFLQRNRIEQGGLDDVIQKQQHEGGKKRLGTFLKDLVALLETFYFHPDLTDIKEKECVILQLGRGKSSAVHTHMEETHNEDIRPPLCKKFRKEHGFESCLWNAVLT